MAVLNGNEVVGTTPKVSDGNACKTFNNFRFISYVRAVGPRRKWLTKTLRVGGKNILNVIFVPIK
jgi:hypothetical protein